MTEPLCPHVIIAAILSVFNEVEENYHFPFYVNFTQESFGIGVFNRRFPLLSPLTFDFSKEAAALSFHSVTQKKRRILLLLSSAASEKGTNGYDLCKAK